MKQRIKKSTFEDKKELELLNKYYDVDTENKMITMPLHYEKASDLIDNRVISKDNYLFDYEELTSISERLKRIPIIYNVNINIQIDDYEDYEPKKLLQGFNDAIELNNFNAAREGRKKWLQVALLLTIGLSILFIMTYGKINSWFGSGNRGAVFSEAIDIFGWVFLWETVTVAFLSPSELGINSFIFKKRVKKVAFLDTNDKELIYENTEEIYKGWNDENRISVLSRWALLISGVSLIILAILNVIEIIGNYGSLFVEFFNNDEAKVEDIVFVIFAFIFVLSESFVLIMGGLLNLSLYRRRNIHKRLSTIFSVLLLLILVINMVLWFIPGAEQSSLTSRVVTFIMISLYVFGVFTTLYRLKKEEKNFIKY